MRRNIRYRAHDSDVRLPVGERLNRRRWTGADDLEPRIRTTREDKRPDLARKPDNGFLVRRVVHYTAEDDERGPGGPRRLTQPRGIHAVGDDLDPSARRDRCH